MGQVGPSILVILGEGGNHLTIWQGRGGGRAGHLPIWLLGGVGGPSP